MIELPQVDWVKNDPKIHSYFLDGSKFLVALRVKNIATVRWEFDVVEINCDGEEMHLMDLNGEYYHTWGWTDFEYFHLIEGEMPTPKGGDE